MRARYYLPGVGRFASADTIVPDPGNPQDLNRYAYVRNSPLQYTDPTGHLMDPGGGGSPPKEPPPPPSEDPPGVELPIEVEVHNMPNPYQPRPVSNTQKRISFVGQVYGIGVDINEAYWIIVPGEQTEDRLGWVDFIVTGLTDYAGNKTYSGYPIPGKPKMLVIGQDTLVNFTDAAVGSAATATGAAAGAIASIFCPEAAGAVQYAWETVIDGSSTLASIANDTLSLFNKMPTFVNMGIYIQDGDLHIVFLVYPVDK